MSGAALQYDDENSLAATAKREEALAAQRLEADPHYDPWLSLEDAERVQRAHAAAAAALPPPQPEELLSEGEAREELRDAIAERESATRAVEAAERVLSRAKQRMDDADAELRSYADLDAKITDFNVEQLKAARDAELPHALAHAQRERSKTLDRLDAAHKTYDRLSAELKAAEHAAQLSREKAHWAAVSVVTCAACQVGEQLREAEARAHALRVELASFAHAALVVPGITPNPTPLPSGLKQLLNTVIKPAAPDADGKERWRSYHAALLSDADASCPAI